MVIKQALRKIRKLPNWVLFLVLFLIAFRLILPSICLWGINYALSNKMENYVGHLHDFDLSLYRGAYQLQGLTIKKRDSDLPPLISVKEIDLSIAWRALLRGEITSDIKIDHLVARLIDGDKKNQEQLGTDEKTEAWQSAFNVIFPLTIETLQARNSEAYFSNYTFGQKLAVSLTKTSLSARDLRSRNNLEGDAVSPFEFEAVLQDHAKIHANGNIDLMTCPNRIDVDLTMEKFDLTSLNKVLRNYIPVDITKGQLDIYLEAASSQNITKGYLKFFLKDGDVIADDQKYKSAPHYFSEIGIGLANWVLKNKETKTTASKVPFEIRNDKFEIKTGKAIWSAIQNKEEEPLKKRLDKSIQLETVEGKNPVRGKACAG